MSLTDEQAWRLNALLQKQGVDCSTLQASNPFEASYGLTPRGKQIRLLVESADPQLSAELQGSADNPEFAPSLAYRAATTSPAFDPEQLTGAVAEEYRRWNPDAAKAQQQANSQALLAKFDRLASASFAQREGEGEAERLEKKAAAEQEFRAESLRRHNEQAKRIQQRQDQLDRMNGGLY